MIMDTYNFALFDAIGIPVEIKEMKYDFSFFILRIVLILLNLIKNLILSSQCNLSSSIIE